MKEKGVVVKCCPFCGGRVKQHPHPDWRPYYLAVYHKDGCWICEGSPPFNFTLLPRRMVKIWNKRSRPSNK